jgi:hypothetical protein
MHAAALTGALAAFDEFISGNTQRSRHSLIAACDKEPKRQIDM